MPINAIAAADKDDKSPAQKRHTAAYQSLAGSVGWLCSNTQPDLSIVHSFISSYLVHPASGHMKATLYVLQYIHSTHDFGIFFLSCNKKSIHMYLHQPDESDIEAFSDAVPPKKGQEHRMTTYSNA